VDLEDAVRHALDGRAVLFTGAGFSHGGTNKDGKAIPSGKALAIELLTTIGYAKGDGALDKAAAAYLRRKTKRDLVTLLTDRFSVRDVTRSHEMLASLPWRRVYTTNYDTIFEEASRRIGKACTPVEGIDHPRDHLSKPGLLIHINGSITRLTEDRLDNSFKLISQSYAADSFENSGWAFHFRNDIRTSAAVVFVGYSMYDLDVRRVLFSEDISSKCVFVVAPLSPDNELDAEDLSDLGVVAPIGVDAFATVVQTIKENYTPQEPDLLLAEWEETRPVDNVLASPTDTEVLDFLVTGDLSASVLLEACGPNKGTYVLERTSLVRLDEDLTKKGTCVLVVGDLGTGKTFVCDCVSQLFLTRGWRVFKLDGGSEDEISEAEAICSLPGDKLLIIENYQRHMNLMRWLSETRPQDCSIALTARANTHEIFATELYEIFADRLRIHDVSRLLREEMKSTVSLFDRYGLWGARIGWGPQRKLQFVARDCSAYLPSVLLDVLESTHITKRYSDLLSQCSNRADLEELLICAFSLEVMAFPPRISHIQELLANRVRWARLRTQSELRAIVDFDANVVRAKSSVLAAHLLRHIFSSKGIVTTLIGMAREAEVRRRERDFYPIFNGLMRYRNISLLLPQENRLASTVNFYEGIKNLSSSRRNPQFWLQYAIACLAFGKLDRAERYFKDAYSLAPDGYDTFQIDNHYARLLLEKALLVSSTSDALPLIDEARKIILQQMTKEVRFYPYRVALGLFRCYDRFVPSWTSEQTAYFKRIFQEIKRRCEAISGNLRDNNYVVECLEKSKKALGVT
jgi:tetratricopeptide (TPR) repeat protein